MNSPKGHASKLPNIVFFMEKMPDDDDDYGDYDLLIMMMMDQIEEIS